MSADSPRRSSGNASRGLVAVPAIVPPQVVSDRSILDSAIGFINEVTLAHQPHTDPKDTITWARFETAADISDPKFGEDWELEGNVAPPLLLILGYGLGVQVWAIPANGEAVEVLSWRHGIVSALRVLPTPSSSVAIEENGRADEPIDVYAEKRPLIALVDGSSSSGAQPQFCAVNFISLKTGTQVKAIKFKNPVIDVLANRSSIVITFHERIAVFDARTLEDRLSITTCYPSPGINPNPIALGQRWLAYAEHKLLHSKRSGGGCDGEGVASYTATVLNASKSLVKGLRELGEQVAAGLTGTSGSTTSSKNTSFDSGTGPDSKQSGIVTIVDIKNPLRDYSPTSGVPMSSNQTAGTDPIVAHFIAHSEALVAMEFDNSGMLLVTADRRGHDFHVFRIQPNPVGPSLAAVHHLYVLHRGDTSAKVQNISFSLDSRWVAVSTLRGTTHVFPITPYGGPMGVRTHTSLHVVNKLSRFHRSAGLSAEGRSSSPISHSESTTFSLSLQPYHNTTLPPYPRPTVVMALAQLRQPFALGSPPGSATLAGGKSGAGGQGSGSQRQRLSSLSDDSGKPLSVCAIFAKSRSWLLDPPNVTREAPHRMQRKAVDSLFVMAGHGALIQYDLGTKLASNVAKEKICDDTPIELEVEAKAQWNLGRRKEGSQEIKPPLSLDNWLVKNRNSCMLTDSSRQYDDSDDRGDSWLAQVEIVTHAGPHRRLWMGPQFVFKTYNTPSGSNLSHVEIEAVEIGTNNKSATSSTTKPEHSSPLNMPLTAAGRSSAVPVLIESGSYSSIEQSPKLMDRFRHDHLDSDYAVAHGDTRLKEDLADAMRESPSVSAASKESGGRGCETGCSSDNIAFYDALAEHDDQDQDSDFPHDRNASAAALASALPNIHSYDTSSSYESIDSLKKPKASIEKIVNPLGTVTTVTSCLTADVQTDILDEVVSQLAAEDSVIHENCDESLFRPVVTIFCDEKTRLKQEEEARMHQELCKPPENISNKLVVPVIAKEVDDALNIKEKQKNITKLKNLQSKESAQISKEQSKFEELSSLNKKSRTAAPITLAKELEEAEEKTSISGGDKVKLAQERERTDDKSKLHDKDSEKRSVENKTTTVAKESEKSKPISMLTKESEKLQEENKKCDEIGKKNENTIKPTKGNDNGKSATAQEKEREKVTVTSKERELAKEIEPSKTEGKIALRKERQRKSAEREVLAKDTAKTEVKEKLKKTTESKDKMPEAENKMMAEKEKSPKLETSKKAVSKAPPVDETEDEKPLEFMRMTPAAEEKTPLPKILSKKELKKQQQQKAKEEEVKTSDNDKKKKAEKAGETKRAEHSTTIKTIEMMDKEKIRRSSITEVKPIKVTEKSEDCTEAPEEMALSCKNPATADNITEKKCKEVLESSETRETEKKEDENTEPNAAVNTKVSAIDETANRKESPANASLMKTKPAMPMKSIIKTEQLNVTDLADSLIELKDDDDAGANECEEKPSKEEEKPKVDITLLEPVDMFTAPTKASKKNKKKANKSDSNSESEEIVEIIKPSVATKATTEEKKSSISSEDSNTDLADRLLENKKHDLEKARYISFDQIEQRKQLDEKRMPKENQEDKSATITKESKTSETKKSEAKQEHTDPKSKESQEDGKQLVKDQQGLPKSKLDANLGDNECKDTPEKNLSKAEEKVAPKSEKETTTQLEKVTDCKITVKEDQVLRKEKTPPKSEECQSKQKTEVKVKEPMDHTVKAKKETQKTSPDNAKDLEQSSEETTESQKKSAEKDLEIAGGREKNEMMKKPGQKLKDTGKAKKALEQEVTTLTSKNTPEIEQSKKSSDKIRDNEESDKEKSVIYKDITKSDETSKTNTSAKKGNDNKMSENKTKDEKKEDKETPQSLEKAVKEPTSFADQKKLGLFNKSLEKEKSETKSKEKDSSETKVTNTQLKTATKDKAAVQSVKRDEVVQIESDKDEHKPQVDKNASKIAHRKDVIVEQPKLQERKKKEEFQEEKLAVGEGNSKHKSNELEKLDKKKPLEASKELSKNQNTQPATPRKKEEEENINKTETPKLQSSPSNKVTPKKDANSGKDGIPTENVKKTTWAAISKQDRNIEQDSPNTADTNKTDEDVYKIKVTESCPKEATASGGTSKAPVVVSPKKSTEKTPLTAPATLPPPPPVTCAWKTLSGADMIAKNLNKQEVKSDPIIFPSLGAITKTPKTSKGDKLLPELPTPKEIKQPLGLTKPVPKKSRNSSALDDFPILKPLDALPPLPMLEPLELISDSKAANIKDISLINFESPLQENPALERKITPPPRGFAEQNLIFALCGSLHYENEQRSRLTPEKSDISPTTPGSSNRSSSALDEPSMADYKSLTENDDPYISLEQSSQDTNTTNTNTTNDKFSSSTNSSGTEEIIIMEEKKMTKKQKRKRQQQLLELQKQKEQQLQQQHHHTPELDDDELRPLIAMSESQIETIADSVGGQPSTVPSLLDESFSMNPLITKSNTLTHSTTTDSEGPMPATTSDDNVFIMPTAIAHSQHKIKTKKLEHKINLIAAIEAATSSSTSSAEESGVELGGGRSHDMDDQPSHSATSLISAAASSSVHPMSMAAVVAAGAGAPVALGSSTVGALKKKTKRRYQFHKAPAGNDKVDGIDKLRNKLNNKKSSDISNTNHDGNTTTTTAMKKKLTEKKSLQMSQDPTQPPQQQQQQANDTHNTIYEMKQQEKEHQQQNNTSSSSSSIQYLTHNAVDNCFGHTDVTTTSGTTTPPPTTTTTTTLGDNAEAATIVNIDIFDDQLSTSSISNTSRFSCETAPLTTTTPPISLNGVIDTNLMHFSQNTTAVGRTTTSGGGNKLSKCYAAATSATSSSSSSSNNDNQRRANYRRGGGNYVDDDDDEDGDEDDENSSNGSAGSL